MKITLVVSSLYGGGAERVVVLLAKAFSDRGHKVTVITQSNHESDFYKLPQEVTRLALGIMSNSSNIFEAVKNNLYRLKKLRQAIISTQPDIVISHLTPTNILTILSLIKTRIPVLATEHLDPRMIHESKSWELLRRITYPFAARVISVSEGVNTAFNWLASNRKSVIYNPFLTPDKHEHNQKMNLDIPGADLEKKWVVSMGRLVEQKGFDILLSAFAKIANKHPNWQLLILGKGQLHQDLETLKENLGLSGKAILVGSVENPFAILNRAKLFVMSSRHEAFPMALGEAMACGLPVISTDCRSGPREIIRDGIDGILVPTEDVTALATAIDKLISDEKERLNLSRYASEVTERFSLEKIMLNWEALFLEIKNTSKKRIKQL
jgi:GalNAc-alpha-(1->4)-GalNAc-alpha-(1->3)-diNAcBac-PP-undecaprenol alpha-1,4-N-acetyl-D-galactosaminyltransferase